MQHALSATTYLAILVALLILTVLTVGLSFCELEGPWHLVAGLSIAVVKASLVVLFFMHVIFSPRLTWVVIVVSLFWLLAVFIALTMSDYFTRGLLPFIPGH